MEGTLATLNRDGGAEGVIYRSVWNKTGQLLFYISKMRTSVLVNAEAISPALYERLSRGAAVRVQSNFTLPQEGRNPGGFSQRQYLLSKNVKLSAYIENDDDVIPLEKSIFSLSALGAGIRFEINRCLGRFLRDAPKHFVLGIMTGDTTEMTADEKVWVQRSGVSHLMAVSGSHVVYILLPFRRVVKKTRLSVAVRSMICILPLSLFIIVAGMTPSVLRAGITCLCSFVGKILARRDDALNSLGLAGCVGLLYNPYAVGDISFQLSYGAVFAIMFVVPCFKRLFLKRENKIAEIFLSGLAINIALLPLLAYHFNMLSVIGLLLNLIASPMATVLCLMGYLLCIIILVPLLSILAEPFSLFLTGLSSLLIKGAEVGANLPAPIGYLRVTSPSFGFFLVYYMILIVILLPPKTKSRLLNKINSFLRSKRCVALASAFTVFMFLLVLLLSRKRNMEILYFDVGQGSSALVRSSDGICGLFDGGNGYTDVSSLLFKNGVGHLDFIALSHGDLDHAGGLQKVLEEHSVDILLVPDNSDDSGTMETVRTAMKNGCQIIAVTRHCSIELSQELQMKIYFERDLESFNNSSLVIQLISTNGNVVFPGDLELSGENQLLREGFPDKCDLLTIAHHGSDSGTGTAFLEKLQPEYAIISVGRNNRYGHPAEKVLDRLSEAGIATYRTDLHGAVRVTFCSRSLVDTWKGQRERIVEIKPWQNEMK